MKLLRRSDVPAYLRLGRLFMSLNEDDDDEIAFEVPVHCFIADTNVTCNADLENLLHTIQYWLCVDDETCVTAVMTYVLSVPLSDELRDILIQFETSMPFLADALICDNRTRNSQLAAACKYGCYDLVKRSIPALLSNSRTDDYLSRCMPGYVMEAAARHGQLKIVTLLVESGVGQTGGACYAAAEEGHLECLKALTDYSKDKELATRAARGGHLAILTFLHKKGCPWDVWATAGAATYGHLNCLKFLHENGCAWDYKTTDFGAADGHVDCLKYAIEHGCDSSSDMCRKVAQNGHLDCLKYLLDLGSHSLDGLCDLAAWGGHLDCLALAHSRGCAWGVSTSNSAAGRGHLACLKFLHENGCPWDASTCDQAAYLGQLECLKYAHESGCPWADRVLVLAAQYGHLHCLKYIEEQGVPLTKEALTKAASTGQFECVEYLHAQGIEWDASTCEAAAGGGHLACLMSLHERGCPWDATTIRASAKVGRGVCVQYAEENGCEVPPEYANIDGRGLHAEHNVTPGNGLYFKGQMPDVDLIPRSADFNCCIGGKPPHFHLWAKKDLARGDPLVLELIRPTAVATKKKRKIV